MFVATKRLVPDVLSANVEAVGLGIRVGIAIGAGQPTIGKSGSGRVPGVSLQLWTGQTIFGAMSKTQFGEAADCSNYLREPN